LESRKLLPLIILTATRPPKFHAHRGKKKT
jgi:hypothetical protein